jgi:xyloglucan-specific endo-beta-1,4-glucanase
MLGLSLRSVGCFSSIALALAFAGCDSGSSNESAGSCKAPSCSDTTRQNNTCDNNGSIQLGKYRVLNNLWGMNHAGVTGSQCSWSTCSGDSGASGISWGTEYNWAGGPAGQVTSYTAAILGWHFSPIPPESGLPIQLSAHQPINCSWSFKVQQTASSIQNVAYDIWLSTEPNAVGDTRPTDEVMIWLYNSGGASPIGGGAVDTLSLKSGNWALSEGTNSTWKVHSFVRTGEADCTDLNLTDFFDFLIDKYGVSPDKYVIGIEAGSEVFSGAGTVTTDHFSCDI